MSLKSIPPGKRIYKKAADLANREGKSVEELVTEIIEERTK